MLVQQPQAHQRRKVGLLGHLKNAKLPLHEGTIRR
jgi:hypothetical protein